MSSGGLVEDAGKPWVAQTDGAAPGAEPDDEGAGAAPPAELGELAAPEVLEGVPDGWDEGTVRLILKATGSAAHMGFAAGHPEAWRMTEADLEAIAPPLARILNRYDVTRAASAMGDEAALFIGFGQYGFRSMRQRGQAIAEAQAEAIDPAIANERGALEGLATPGAE